MSRSDAKVASKSSADATKSELEEQLAAAAERSKLILERERSLERTFADIKSEPSGTDLNELLAYLMSDCTAKTRQALVEAHESATGPMLTSAFIAARRVMTAAKSDEARASVS